MLYNHKNGLSLNKVEENDLQELKYLKDESWLGTHKISIVNMVNQRDWFEKISRSHTDLFFIVYDEEEKVGFFSIQDIDWISRKGNNSYAVFRNSRKKGYGKKLMEMGVSFAFEVLNLNKLECEVLENNLASLSILKTVGYLKEGEKKKSIYKNNRWFNSTILGILKEDWEKLEVSIVSKI